jgi:hypothetical protein
VVPGPQISTILALHDAVRGPYGDGPGGLGDVLDGVADKTEIFAPSEIFARLSQLITGATADTEARYATQSKSGCIRCSWTWTGFFSLPQVDMRCVYNVRDKRV